MIADGRKDLLDAEPGSLDVVVVDTLRPQSGYSGNLYSREFYELVADRLDDDGVFTQWLPTSRTLDTMQETFPHLLVFTVPTYFDSQFAIASESPITFDRERILAALERADTSVFPPGFEEAIVRFVTETQPAPVAGGRPIEDERRNEDLFPRDEYWLNNEAGRG